MAKTATWRNTPFAHKFYHSREWQQVRSLVWDRAHGLCERCLERGEVRPANVVHHTTPLTPENMGDPDISLNPERLMALCHDCHTEVHNMLGVGMLGTTKYETCRVKFDEDGNVVKP